MDIFWNYMYTMAVQQFFVWTGSQENKLNNDKERSGQNQSLCAFSRPYSYFSRSYMKSNFGKNMKARLVRIECLFSYKCLKFQGSITLQPLHQKHSNFAR